MSRVGIVDRIISVLTYFTMGIFGLIWILYAFITKTEITPFVSFNIYQSIFISVVLWAFSLVYQIGLNLLSVIPFIGKLAVSFDTFLNGTPIYLGFSISGLLMVILLSYLAILSLLGKRPYIPAISDVINTNFGG